MNPLIKKQVEEKLRDWEEKGIIQKAENYPRWTSPLVPVLKKDHTIRLCVDFRRLNAASKPQIFPIRSIVEALAKLSGKKLFSTIDCQDAFHSIPMDGESQDLAAIVTTSAVYVCKKMPFGLQGSSQTFSKAVAGIVQRLPEDTALNYIDDAICAANSFQEMIKKLDNLLSAYASAGLIIKAKKTQLFDEQVNFLGFKISANGIGVVPEYISAILQIKPPATVTQSRSFLGKMNYYRRFIPRYSEIASPIVDATTAANKNGDKRIKQTPEFLQAVESLKTAITTEPILAHPQWGEHDEKFNLYTDWSNKAIAAKITQDQFDDETGKLVQRVIL